MSNFLKLSRFFILILIAVCALIVIVAFLVWHPAWQLLPVENKSQGIKGAVLIGPTCPMQRIPPDPRCADKLLATSLAVATADGTQIVKQFNSNGDGKFNVSLPVGEYIIRSADTVKFYPRCGVNGTIKVVAGQYTDTTVFCDSGIR